MPQSLAAPTPELAETLLSRSGALASGHFLLSSGLHGARYFQCARLTESPAETEAVARAVAERCAGLGATTVLAPALGAITWGHELARALGLRSVFAERPDGAFELRRGFALSPGERVLLAENVVTTGVSVLETAALVRRLGAVVAGYAVIVDRSGGAFAPDEPVIAYAALNAPALPADRCPLCADGQALTKPGSRVVFPPPKT